MAAYFGYMLLAGIQLPLFYKKDRLNRQYFYKSRYLILCLLELLLLTGLRGYTVGADTASYLSALTYYSKMSFSELLTAELVWPYDYEIGYFLMVKLCALLKIGKTGFLFLIAFLVYIPTFRAVKKYSPMPYISILCYFGLGFFTYSLGIFRQMIASSILLCGWRYVEERQLVKYLLTVALAMLFHTTAIVAVVLYFVYGINWHRFIGWIIPAEIGLLVFGRVVALLVTRIFPMYDGYVGSQYDTQGGTYLMLIMLNIVLLGSILFRNEAEKKHEDMMICALVLAICIQCIGYSMGALGRATRHFSVYMIFAIPCVLTNLKKKIGYQWAFVVSLVVVLCLFALAYRDFDGNKYVVPYYTVFG